jgi:lysophospholipase L1-like esterase
MKDKYSFSFILVFLLVSMAWAGLARGENTPTPTPTPLANIQGVFWEFGDLILAGRDLKPDEKKYADIFTSWLNEHYGPVTEMHDTESIYTSELSEQIESKLAGVTMSLCVLEIGMRNLEWRLGGPNVSNCGGCSLRTGLLASFHYGADLQKILSVIRSHMAPGGLILMTNLYEYDECTKDRYEDWNEYPQIVRMYNNVAAMAAEVNGAKLVDLFTLMADHPSYMEPCSLFPNAAGHAAIAALLEKTVKESLPFPPKPKNPVKQ